MSILVANDVHGFFSETVGEALSAHKVELSGGAREYLVGLLVDFASKGSTDETLRRPVTLLLDEALQAPATERFEKLKDLGDGSLRVSGLFREHLSARGVDVRYVSSVGATAYRSAAALRRGGDGLDILGELAQKFGRLASALGEVADAIFSGPLDSPEGVLRVYDRWQKTGSERLGRALIAHGLVPLKPVGGLQLGDRAPPGGGLALLARRAHPAQARAPLPPRTAPRGR